jgi:hypothetical protein
VHVEAQPVESGGPGEGGFLGFHELDGGGLEEGTAADAIDAVDEP